MYFFYNIVLHIVFVLSIPYFLFKMAVKGKYRQGIKERFGFIEQSKIDALKGGKVVWIHAVSVGETKAVLPLVKLLKSENKNIKILFSTTTPTGNKIARKEGALFIDALIYFPLDLPSIIKRIVRLIDPRSLIVVEKEIWPNTVRIFHNEKRPVIVVNGTISDKSYSRYKLFGFLFKDVFESIDYFCARTDGDAAKALQLGVEKNKTFVPGNLKFDSTPSGSDASKGEALMKALNISKEDKVLVVGSTHEGEEEIIIDVYKKLKNTFSNLKLIIAPRHPERFNAVEEIIKKKNLPMIRKSAAGKDNSNRDTILLDTIGELSWVYSMSTISFIGGTLKDIGGHNLLEPAYYGKPVLYGPHLKSYKYMAEMLEAANASFRVTGEEDLYNKIKTLLEDNNLCETMGKNASTVVESNRGVTRRTLDIIEKVLD